MGHGFHSHVKLSEGRRVLDSRSQEPHATIPPAGSHSYPTNTPSMSRVKHIFHPHFWCWNPNFWWQYHDFWLWNRLNLQSLMAKSPLLLVRSEDLTGTATILRRVAQAHHIARTPCANAWLWVGCGLCSVTWPLGYQNPSIYLLG